MRAGRIRRCYGCWSANALRSPNSTAAFVRVAHCAACVARPRRSLFSPDWLPEQQPDVSMTAPLLSPAQVALSDHELAAIDRWWRAANYLTVGQIYLTDNPLLRRPLAPEDIKPRLLGHWGTSPGLTFIHAHLNRIIRRDDREILFVCGPGHGGPAMLACAWLDGGYEQVYPEIGRNASGMARLFRQFSFPGGVPSHTGPETPGSIHEGGELGYSLAHAFGAAFDNPTLAVACVVGDGEAETGPLATAWHSNKFLNPATDGAVLPI